MRKTHILLLAFTLFMPVSAYSADPTPPPEVRSELPEATLHGEGAFSRFGFHLYDASLWTLRENWSPQSPFALSLTYRVSIDRDRLVETTREEMNRLYGPVRNYDQELTRVFPEVADGDRITAILVKPGTVRFYHNGRLTGDVVDAAFAEPFFGIWLDPDTKAPDLRTALLKSSTP